MGDLPAVFAKLKAFIEMFKEDEIKTILEESCKDMSEEIDFEHFLRVIFWNMVLCLYYAFGHHKIIHIY